MGMYENIENGKYKNTKPYPDRPKQDPILKKTIGELSLEEITKAKDKQSQYEEEKKNYTKLVDEWRKEEGRMNSLFFDDCAKEEGIENHPKRSSVEVKAWEHGHASGYGDIWYWYKEFAELIR